MKKAIKGIVVAMLAVVMMFGLQQGVLKADSNSSNDRNLEGAWDVVIWLPFGPNGSFVPTPFRILRTIGPVGIVDGYGFPALTFTPGATNGTGHGDYKRIGKDRNRDRDVYSATVKYFELNAVPDAQTNSVVNSIQTVRETIRLSSDGNSYESDFLTTFTSPSGQVLGTNGGKTKATRIVVQPLP
ncbi:MAG: hypothetical protein ABL967_07495 [Bryobacteraceae bacterium]